MQNHYFELGKMKLDGKNVTTFPKLPEMQQVTLKVLRWKESDKRLVINDSRMVACRLTLFNILIPVLKVIGVLQASGG